jgi:hypothetical protein
LVAAGSLEGRGRTMGMTAYAMLPITSPAATALRDLRAILDVLRTGLRS